MANSNPFAMLNQGAPQLASPNESASLSIGISQPLADAIETLAYACLEQKHCGWENNEGGYGEFVFDVAKGTIALDYNERVETSQNYTHEF